MTHEIIRHLLDDYVTGDLDPDAGDAVRSHVAACAICNAEVEGLRQVLSSASQLPRSIDSPVEAWANIKSAILGEKTAQLDYRRDARGFFSVHPLATALAAAALVAIVSSGATFAYMAARNGNARDARATQAGDPATPASLAAFTVEENNYLRTVSTLEDILDRQENVLAPETVAQLKTSLRTIDEAILEARGALARDPANKLLIEMLSANYRQKVDLLRRSTEMTRGS
jgi:anti-sigma factor RsiW